MTRSPSLITAIVAQDSTSALLARLDRKEVRITVDRDLNALPDGLSGPGVDAAIENSVKSWSASRPARCRWAACWMR